MSRTNVEQLLYLLDQAFEGNPDQSLLGNLNGSKPEEWWWAPRDGARAVGHIAGHVIGCKLMYQHFAFDKVTWTWDTPLATALPGLDIDERLTIDGLARPPAGAEPGQADLITWLKESQGLLRLSIEALEDEDLAMDRALNWGGTAETRWIINVMIQHDLYHAGEINYLLAILRGSDYWDW